MLTHEMYRTAINELDAKFDTHDVEKRMLRNNGEAFGRELTAWGDLHPLSAAIGRTIDSQFQGQLRKVNKVRTENLGGKPSLNQCWEKLFCTVE